MTCSHTLWEIKEAYISGYCPICLKDMLNKWTKPFDFWNTPEENEAWKHLQDVPESKPNPHKAVYEYDGAFKCLDCGATWGALPGKPEMPSSCPFPCDTPEEALARKFHTIYERLAPNFGYETRPDTREFNAESKNGKLMIAVCKVILNKET